MICSDIRPVLHAYIDEELDPVQCRNIEQHLESCSSCLALVQQYQTLQKSLSATGMGYPLPREVEQRIRRSIHHDDEGLRSRIHVSPRIIAYAALGVLAVSAIFWLFVFPARIGPDEMIALEAIQSHVRSLMPNHLIDVASSDQHTVKPWFNGKVDFSPPVKDVSAEGFVLVGGRMDYLNNRTVAVIIYQRRLHIINLFVWPAQDAGAKELHSFTRQGYHLCTWSSGGMSFIAASDINPPELEDFTRRIRE